MSEYYDSLAANPNNISFWLPKLMEKYPFEEFDIPRTAIVKVPEEIVELFFMEKKGMSQQQIMVKIMEWVNEEFIPQAEKEIGGGFWFIKNGAFSNKYSFRCCKNISSNAMQLTCNIIDINYTSFMFDTGGNTELVAREFIPALDDIPTIYEGMPLRDEIRIFYDFDHKCVLYAVNYWDWDYCYEAISRNETDRIVYESRYPSLWRGYQVFSKEIIPIAENALKDVEGLSGIWSVDFMKNGNQVYLIDMALGECSAYWDAERVDKALKQRGFAR